ncbi:hypothetical protein NCCP2222_34790 [Sporosarcina sp. NCCP-2222]|uniref:CD3324 family protein n=1 Tax=Sporosarcina sp. NCCP-2222 TaxID=2935073 RepID=UPI002080AE42|nr:CD3324 family protein [Sporosarcina sp. NCCP-2222]GKV57532.1 hypothetical protein NCCP2222_34790 [Sporosarcina sp. NCCP-2222]
MKYFNAESILPKELVEELQKYVNGEMVYVPIAKDLHKRWGECSGIKKQLTARNHAIRQQFSLGVTIEQLSNQFFLSHDSIKKIVYTKK